MDNQTQILNLIAQELNMEPAMAIVALATLAVWSLIWKGIALWKASRLGHKGWFIALLLINSAGILEIFYIFFLARNYEVEVIEKKG